KWRVEATFSKGDRREGRACRPHHHRLRGRARPRDAQGRGHRRQPRRRRDEGGRLPGRLLLPPQGREDGPARANRASQLLPVQGPCVVFFLQGRRRERGVDLRGPLRRHARDQGAPRLLPQQGRLDRGGMRHGLRLLAALLLGLAAAAAQGRPVTPRDALNESERAVIDMFEKSKRSVVYITTSERVRDFWTRNIRSIPKGTG